MCITYSALIFVLAATAAVYADSVIYYKQCTLNTNECSEVSAQVRSGEIENLILFSAAGAGYVNYLDTTPTGLSRNHTRLGANVQTCSAVNTCTISSACDGFVGQKYLLRNAQCYQPYTGKYCWQGTCEDNGQYCFAEATCGGIVV